VPTPLLACLNMIITTNNSRWYNSRLRVLVASKFLSYFSKMAHQDSHNSSSNLLLLNWWCNSSSNNSQLHRNSSNFHQPPSLMGFSGEMLQIQIISRSSSLVHLRIIILKCNSSRSPWPLMPSLQALSLTTRGMRRHNRLATHRRCHLGISKTFLKCGMQLKA
jgi:hypothetical protein